MWFDWIFSKSEQKAQADAERQLVLLKKERARIFRDRMNDAHSDRWHCRIGWVRLKGLS